MTRRKVKDVCGCGNVIPIFAVLAEDPFCSGACCRRAHGVAEPAYGERSEDMLYRANAGAMGSYGGASSGAPTRLQRQAVARDRLAREALGMS